MNVNSSPINHNSVRIKNYTKDDIIELIYLLSNNIHSQQSL